MNDEFRGYNVNILEHIPSEESFINRCLRSCSCGFLFPLNYHFVF